MQMISIACSENALKEYQRERRGEKSGLFPCPKCRSTDRLRHQTVFVLVLLGSGGSTVVVLRKSQL